MRPANVVHSLAVGLIAAALLALPIAGCGGEPDRTSPGPTTSASTGGTGGTGGTAGSSDASSSGSSSSGPVQPSGASLLVQVLDDAGKPLPSALVTPAGATQPSLTDGAGYALFEDLTPGRFSARVEHLGFAPGALGIDLPKGAHGGTELRLLPLPKPIAFVAENGASIDTGPVHVTLPPAALIDRNGEPVTGPVEATIVPIDPSAGLTTLPGPLEGETVTGGAVSLESMSMAEVTVWQNGLPVQLAPGYRATLEIVLPEAMMPKVYPGESIPAWWLDLDASVWREDGAGVVQPSMAEPGKLAWVVEVSHFTWWNCDRPWTDANCFIVTVHSPDGMGGMPDQIVNSIGVSYPSAQPPVFTDASGKACVDIMLGGTATISVGPRAMPYASVTVTGSGPTGNCAGSGTACVVLEPGLTIPFNAICTAGEHQDCAGYQGPPGTQGVGICKSPSRVCNASGTAWSGCAGEVLPAPESCKTPVDDDCDGLINEEGDDCPCTPGATVACYTGPAGTLDVGLCHGGTRTCANDGMSYGPCVGQVLPAAEDCSMPGADVNCDGVNNCLGLALWSKKFGDFATQHPMSMDVDEADNILLTGTFGSDGGYANQIDLGGGPIVSTTGFSELFAAKFNPKGNLLWSKHIDPSWSMSSAVMKADGAGNAMLVTSGNGVRIDKLDALGHPIWSKSFCQPAHNCSAVIYLDKVGDILLLGSFKGTLDLGGAPLTNTDPLGRSMRFIAKLDPQGNHLWSKILSDGISTQYNPPKPEGLTAATDGAGNIALRVDHQGTVDFGGGPLKSVGSDLFIAKLDPQGGLLWSKQIVNMSEGYGGSMHLDGSGNILLEGSFRGTLDLGGGPLVSTYQDQPGRNFYVAKLDPQGNHLWSKQFGVFGDQESIVMSLDMADNLLLTGAFNGQIDFGGGAFSGASPPYTSHNIFVAKLDSQGHHIWSKPYGDAADQWGDIIRADHAGNILLAGSLLSKVDFGNGPLVVAGNYDIFFAKLRP